MNKKKFRNFSIINARVTSTISVALVLLMLGIVAVTAIGADNLTRQIKENLGFNISFREDTPAEVAEQLADGIRKEPFARVVTLYTPEDAVLRWQQETGENIVELLGVNPFSAEIEVRVFADYATGEALGALRDRYAALEPVEEVTLNSESVASINDKLKTLVIILGSVSLALLIISLVLINNTVRLTVFARRFTIHTMKLVGATDGFIRRPFVVASMLNGAVAGVLASAVLAALVGYGMNVEPLVARIVSWREMAPVFGVIVIAGVIICAAAAAFSTGRYLRMSYDDMFE